jgi:hypothetical protein
LVEATKEPHRDLFNPCLPLGKRVGETDDDYAMGEGEYGRIIG